MARLAVIFTVISLLFTISHARFIQVHDVTPDETVNDLPEFDPEKATAILLPSERPGFEPAKLIDFKHDDASETESDVDSLPLTMVSFRPINRHFPRRPIIPFRHKHNCRLHKRFRSLNPQFQQKRYISYGDDMILSDDQKTDVDPESRGSVRQIQARWARFPEDGAEFKEARGFIKAHHHEHEEEHDHDDDHHHHEHDDHDHDEHHHHHFRRRHHHHGEEDENDDKEEHEHDYLHGYIKRFRKFFGLF